MKIRLTLLILLVVKTLFAQTNIEQVFDQIKTNPKPIILYYYTDWCAYCKIQESEIQNNSNLKSELENHFYFIKINADSKQSHQLIKKQFHIDFDEVKSYPFWIILNKNQTILGRYSGYINQNNFENLIEEIKKE